MVKLVFAGHTNRGGEIIKLLEMLGGKNINGFKKTFAGFYYFINENNEITPSDMPPANSMVYSLEDFEKEYPYKVGDLVRYFPHKVSVISSMFITYDGDVKYAIDDVDDYFFQAHQLEYVGRPECSESKNIQHSYKCGDVVMLNFRNGDTAEIEQLIYEGLFNGEIVVIEECLPIENDILKYRVLLHTSCQQYYNISENVIKQKLSQEKQDLTQVNMIDLTHNSNQPDEIEVVLGDYEFVLKDGKTYFVKKKPKYPQNYKECCSILGFNDAYDLNHIATHDVVYDYKLQNFYRLFICRNAYWKIAGEEMGLDKPWDSTYGCGEWGYWVGYDINENKIYCQDSRILLNNLLVFPTEEMRDVFYENFKDLIEQCKEFL